MSGGTTTSFKWCTHPHPTIGTHCGTITLPAAGSAG